ncbi:MAG TPA: squalene--hopene cyclase [Xanthomonadales bacterium]|nr:squalene--hopene cyclase [Xanthomonadales bacterium]
MINQPSTPAGMDAVRPDTHGRDALAAPWRERVETALRQAVSALLARQCQDGHWCFELEADCTIPSEYILLKHFIGEPEPALEAKLASYIRSRQGADGGWPLYFDGEMDISCTIKAYYALKLVGDDPEAPHMRRAREAILARGGAARANVFTRIALAMFEQVPWRAVPYMPPEILLLPRWFPFHLGKVAYWSRTVMVPLFVIWAFKPRAVNPRGVDVAELFTVPAEQERDYFPIRSPLNQGLLWLERSARTLLEPLVPGFVRRQALGRAEEWIVERLNGEDGLGAIFPAMVNAYLALRLLGYAPDHPLRRTARRAIDKLLVEHDGYAYCQPCVSPIWDTGLACLALQAVEDPALDTAIRQALDWLAERQVADEPGDWRDRHPGLAGGGWAFQYANPHYPDLDDTAVVAWAMDQHPERARYAEAVSRAGHWLAGMQSRNGGFAAFDSDNTYYYLNHIPFADHGALLDPPTADVSARVLALLGRLHRSEQATVRSRVLDYLKAEQEASGAWFGRWGSNYIYGTWSVLSALEQAGIAMDQAWIQRAADWLESVQQADGGWGESNDSYADTRLAGGGADGSAHQTAWAVLALIACGRADSAAVRRGIAWLVEHQEQDGLWHEPWFTAPGFPRVFYLKYHGYSAYFPIWALARYARAPTRH